MGPLEPLTSVPGVDNAEDQVMRLAAFKREHPEWRITCDRDYHVWRAWRLLEGGEDNLTRYYLRDLLDALDKRA